MTQSVAAPVSAAVGTDMSEAMETPSRGTVGQQDAEIVMPGFRGRVVGQFSGMLVIEGEIDGDLPAHEASADELAVVLSGSVEVEVSGRQMRLGPGQHLVVPAGATHKVRALGPARVLLVGAAD